MVDVSLVLFLTVLCVTVQVVKLFKTPMALATV